MKKKLLFILIALVLVGGIFIAFCLNNSKIEEDTWMRKQEDRVALYFINRYELTNGDDIEEIEIVQFEKNSMTGYCRVVLSANNKYNIAFSLNSDNDEIRTSNYLPENFKKKPIDDNLTELPIKMKYIERE
ncbi:hypothetical protein [Streptococcus sp. CSL10205-OR2]|uniref:hypothetical protein n=1 Tax=Streptococcus sp. CSL10205-OR2 TaxID=2980558 RepID=UPI0021DA8621|nr:hypothetical protein [Streptococcus sp. CSL10205-OR2]MCU9533189.1 hypothetical protein [Streptococcus sp. CSL10205-OR2]